jgi:hypothetical protein
MLKPPRNNRDLIFLISGKFGETIHGRRARDRSPPRRVVQCLFQRAIDRVKHGVQVAAEAVDGSKDRDRNACRDQTIFDRGGTGLVGQELCKSRFQDSLRY